MGIRFKSLGSGSAGNGTVVQCWQGQERVNLLIDCGFGLKDLLGRLAQAQLGPADLSGVFITHEHSDHIGCAVSFALRHRLPLIMSAGTYHAIGTPALGDCLRLTKDDDAVELGPLLIHPFTVPHDAAEPLQLTCTDGVMKLGILTDVGEATPHLVRHLQGCHGLLLESNHDAKMLADSSYPSSLKRRISGPQGHLENQAAASIAAQVNGPQLSTLVAGHLSEKNNRPDLVVSVISRTLGCAPSDIIVATAQSGTPWLSLSA